MTVGLTGQLGAFHLQNIIALLQVERQTGALRLDGGEGRAATLYLADGQILHAVCGPHVGFEAAREPFAWGTGTFAFEAGLPAPEPTITETNAAIVAAGRKYAAEMAEALARIPSLHLILKLVPQPRSPRDTINLTPDEWRFLTLVDGRRDLKALVALLGRDPDTVRAIAGRLLKNGLVQLVDPRRSMARMVVQPSDRAGLDIGLMDTLALEVLLQGQRPRRQIPIQVLTSADQTETVLVEGQPDLANRLLLSATLMSRLQVKRNEYVYIKLLEE